MSPDHDLDMCATLSTRDDSILCRLFTSGGSKILRPIKTNTISKILYIRHVDL